jgi:monoamine oxidase
MFNNKNADVIIIGAGISGLQTASLLKQQGISVAVLEARDRVGGRSLNHQFDNGDLVDVGGQWIGPGHDRMYALAKQHNIATYPLYNRGKNLIRFRQALTKYSGTIPKLSPVHLLQVGWLLWRFESMAASINPEAPYEHKHAHKWDSMTVLTWMNRNSLSDAAKKVFAIGIKAIFTVEPKEISMLHALFYAKSGISLDNLMSVDGGAQQDRIHGGTQGICQALANTLGDELKLDHPVMSVQHGLETVTVTCKNGHTFTADKLISTVPPNQLLRISFDPLLPSIKDQMWQRMPAGSCIKCVAQYETPFWRDNNLSGQSVGLDNDLLVNVTFDNTEKGKTAGLLMGFIEGDNARLWGQKSDDERRQAVLSCFAQYFGEQALSPIDYVDKDWSKEQWTRGCYAASFGVGAWTEFGAHLATPIGPIHFAGTETASQWYGYFEGALQSAERVVTEITGVTESAAD